MNSTLFISGPILGAGMFMLTGHRPVMNNLLNTKFELNLSNRRVRLMRMVKIYRSSISTSPHVFMASYVIKHMTLLPSPFIEPK
jgi:hypothetical protein